MGKNKNRSFDRLAKKILSNRVGYLLEPNLNPDEKLIRRELSKALRKEGWKSKYNTPYNRRKFYDRISKEIASTQKQENLDGRKISRINRTLKKWYDSEENKRLSNPLIEGEVIATNDENPFEWIDGMEIAIARHPDFEILVSIKDTGEIWKGNYDYITKNKTSITDAARLWGSEGGGYIIQIDEKSKLIKITFIKKGEV